MNTKRRRNVRQAPEDLTKPSAWRRQHGDIEAGYRGTDPDTGAVVTHHRATDTLGMMLSHGTITDAMHSAGLTFRFLFRTAQLDSMGNSSLARSPGRATPGSSDHHVTARLRVAEALDVLGGHDSAAGSCAWHVLGCQSSVREWAVRQGWGGRPVPSPQAQGMLVATLSVLAAHFGQSPRCRAA